MKMNMQEINSSNEEIERLETTVDTKDKKISVIEMYGEVLTDKNYITNQAIAREEEINRMILAIITPDKSALLVGKPGIGKTALVEGLEIGRAHV